MKTGRGGYLWHLEQAAIHQLLADRHSRRGHHWHAEREYEKAQAHRETAAVLDRADKSAA